MLPLVPAGSPLTAEQVRQELLFSTGTRRMEYRFDIVDRRGAYVRDATKIVMKASIENNALADIKRTASLSILDDGSINLAREFIRPWARLIIGTSFVEWPLGVFTLSSPKRTLDTGASVVRDIDAFDLLMLLDQDLAPKRYTVAAGTLYTDAVRAILADYSIDLEPSRSTLRVAMEWDPGTSMLDILNDLLGAINYRSMTADAYGRLVVRPYLAPSARWPEFTYDTGTLSVIEGAPTHELDLYSVPNRWIVTQSDPELLPLRSVYTNDSPTSPTSTVSRGRIIAEYLEVEAADQATLNALAQRAAFEASQVYEAVEFETAVMPMHADADVYALRIPGLAIDASYSEQTWSFDLEPGASMKHRARRVVTV